MEEQIKRIEIPDFITIKIVKINNKHCAYYVEDYSNEYFYADKDDFLQTYTRDKISFTLTLDIPFTISIINVEHLENAIKKLHKELIKNKIPRAEKDTKYYFITQNFEVEDYKERNDYIDNTLYNSFNYFTSESQARKFASKMQDYLIELWKEELKK